LAAPFARIVHCQSHQGFIITLIGQTFSVSTVLRNNLAKLLLSQISVIWY